MPRKTWSPNSASYSPSRSANAADGVHQPLLWVTVALLAFGLVMVYSASIALPDNPRFARYAHTHFLVRHLLSLGLAFVVALLAFQVPVATWEKAAPWLFVGALALLIIVLMPSIKKKREEAFVEE